MTWSLHVQLKWHNFYIWIGTCEQCHGRHGDTIFFIIYYIYFGSSFSVMHHGETHTTFASLFNNCISFLLLFQINTIKSIIKGLFFKKISSHSTYYLLLCSSIAHKVHWWANRYFCRSSQAKKPRKKNYSKYVQNTASDHNMRDLCSIVFTYFENIYWMFPSCATILTVSLHGVFRWLLGRVYSM